MRVATRQRSKQDLVGDSSSICSECLLIALVPSKVLRTTCTKRSVHCKKVLLNAVREAICLNCLDQIDQFCQDGHVQENGTDHASFSRDWTRYDCAVDHNCGSRARIGQIRCHVRSVRLGITHHLFSARFIRCVRQGIQLWRWDRKPQWGSNRADWRRSKRRNDGRKQLRALRQPLT